MYLAKFSDEFIPSDWTGGRGSEVGETSRFWDEDVRITFGTNIGQCLSDGRKHWNIAQSLPGDSVFWRRGAGGRERGGCVWRR